MTTQALKKVNDLLESSGINYSFLRYDGSISITYWVGNYSESEEYGEGGRSDIDFTITGTTEGSIKDLILEAEKIKNLLLDYRCVISNGHGMSIAYERMMIIPQEVDVIKRIQINLSIKEWRN